MQFMRHGLVSLAMLCLGGTAVVGQSDMTTPGSPAGPMRVTTDTMEYCAQLASRIVSPVSGTPLPENVLMLTGEGERMCQAHHVRMGIARLRRAWMLLHPEQ